MSHPAKGRSTRQPQGRGALAGTSMQSSETAMATASEPAPTVSSPLTPEEVLTQGAPLPLQEPPRNREAYERFSGDFDQEDDVDEYALLHPNSPKMSMVHTEVADVAHPMLISPELSAVPGPSTGPPRRIQFKSPIVLHSPVVTPTDAPATKRQHRKNSSPAKQVSKGKAREQPTEEEEEIAAQQTMLQYWSDNPLPRPPAPLHPPVGGEQPLPESDNADINAFIWDISNYARRIHELGPEAMAGLIFHAHKRLQDNLIPSAQLPLNDHLDSPTHLHVPERQHPMPRIPEVQRFGLLPSPVIVHPGTGESV
jgi:hypothetical protein